MNYAQLLFPDFSLILIGYLVCRFTPLNRPVWTQVEQLVYFLFFPVLLFQSIVKSPLDIGAAGNLVGAGWALGLGGIAMAYSVPYWPGFKHHFAARQHAGSAQIGFRFNSFIGLALADKLAGAPGLAVVALLIGVSVPLMNIGAVWPMARHGQRGFLAELVRNPLIIGTAGGLLANLAGFHMPDWLEPTVSRIGGASLALGLMAAGAGMQLGALNHAKLLGVALLLIRHLLMPVLALGLSHLFGLNPLQSTILLMFAALPTASSCYVLAARMGYDGAYVAALVTASTVLGMVSLPLALGLLR
ncbi:MAG: AEC family transporter [Betaproteobacteria bacterium]|nr:AEC family transporter [Betaproteobacteria bacterium]NCP81584.1 AEC family transporter [Rhodoferax sp.]OIP19675.1 MAG: transporter [Comamonadaceae bacterium CG2_30_57_122]PIZ21942.1 MAG: transporter [Comamonadaceae bacterium CG_4_10_14_0_8_um_filter_57_29]PJC20500.1 MAG: transporter [Comamonadaceae bacterium CG_4_9_14_0_8_um_filter_57_21]